MVKSKKSKRESKGVVTHLKVRMGACAFVRTLLAKPCTDESLGEKKELSVFLSGVPRETSQKDLEIALSVFGDVERSAIQQANKSAIVIFKKKKSVAAVFNEKAESEVLPASALKRGDQGAYRLLKDYRKERVGNKILLDRVNKWIESKEEEEERLRKEREAAAESDGWTVVTTRKGRHKNRDAQGVNVSAVAKLKAESKRKDAALHKDFYHFQQREARRNEILELQSKFREDKKRIAELRAKRKFNPYLM